MNVRQAKRFVAGMVGARVPVPLLLVGGMGIGKTEVVRQVGAEQGLQVINLRLSNIPEVGDLSGLPLIVDGRTGYAPPRWWPERPGGILFLDEINRANRELLQAVFELVDSRRLFARSLPADWTVIAAMNPPVAEYVVEPLGPAFLRRFCQVRVEPSSRTWLEWARGAGIAVDIRDFISQQPGFLCRPEDFELEVVETPEGWRMVDEILRAGVIPAGLDNEIVAGLVGPEAASAFFDFRSRGSRGYVTGDQILHDWAAVRPRFLAAETDQVFRSMTSLEEVISALAGSLPPTELAHLLAFLEDSEVPDEWRNHALLGVRRNPALRAQLQELVRFQRVAVVLKGKAMPARRRRRRPA